MIPSRLFSTRLYGWWCVWARLIRSSWSTYSSFLGIMHSMSSGRSFFALLPFLHVKSGMNILDTCGSTILGEIMLWFEHASYLPFFQVYSNTELSTQRCITKEYKEKYLGRKPRIGQTVWLLIITISLETAAILKYSLALNLFSKATSFDARYWGPWATSSVLFLSYFTIHCWYFYRGTRAYPRWLKMLKWSSALPLLLLCRLYAFWIARVCNLLWCFGMIKMQESINSKEQGIFTRDGAFIKSNRTMIIVDWTLSFKIVTHIRTYEYANFFYVVIRNNKMILCQITHNDIVPNNPYIYFFLALFFVLTLFLTWFPLVKHIWHADVWWLSGITFAMISTISWLTSISIL